MIIDSLLELSREQAVTATSESTNMIDFRTPAPNVGNYAMQMYAVLTINEEFKGLSGLTFSLEHSDQPTSGFSKLSTYRSLPAAELKPGKVHVLPMAVSHKRYVRAHFAVSGSGTAGKLSVAIVHGIQNNEPMPDRV